MISESDIRKVYSIIKELRGTTSINKKIEILERNKESEALKKVLQYTYDYRKQFKMSSDKLPDVSKVAYLFPPSIDDIFKFLDMCCEKEALTDRDKETFARMIKYYGGEIEELFKCIIDKDLKCGINVKTIKKVFGEDFIPEFGVMLAESSDKLDEFLKRNKEFYVNYKYDGVRLITIIDVVNRKIEFWSRNGRKYNFPFLESDIRNNFDFDKLVSEHEGIKTVMLDGELVVGNNEFQKLMTIVKRKSIHPSVWASIEKCVRYWLFDCVLNDVGNDVLRGRIVWLKSIFECYGLNNSKYCRMVKYWTRNNKDDVMKDLNDAIANGYEGLMLKAMYSPYVKERSIDWVKVKKFDTLDVVVVGIEEGTGKYKGMVGALICEDEEGKKFKVGSGLTDDLRIKWWKNPNEIVGKVIEVKFQELTESNIPRFPIFVRVRDDKC